MKRLILFVFTLSSVVLYSQSFQKHFEYEGNNPLSDKNDLRFSAIESKYLTKNGHGWRNEYKKAEPFRKSMYETSEWFTCVLEIKIDNGMKTIITQYHEKGENTLLLVYVSDFDNKGMINGVYNDGIFDIYVKYKDIKNNKTTKPIGIIKNGEKINYSFMNINGNIEIKFNDKLISFNTSDSNYVYLKFGDYLQAQDHKTRDYLKHECFPEFYRNVEKDEVIFHNFEYLGNS